MNSKIPKTLCANLYQVVGVAVGILGEGIAVDPITGRAFHWAFVGFLVVVLGLNVFDWLIGGFVCGRC